MNRKPVFRRHLAATLSILLTFVFISLAVYGPATMDARAVTFDEITQGAGIAVSAFDGPGALIGYGTQGMVDWIIEQIMGKKQDAAFLDAKEAYAHQLKNVTDNYIGLAHTANLNTINNYEAMQYFFARKAEYAALQLYQYQEEHNLAHTYDPWYVLRESQVANGTMAAEWYVAQQYAAILNSYSDLATTFVGTYDGMEWGVCSQDHPTGYGGDTVATSTMNDKTYRVEIIGMEVSAGNYYYTLSSNMTYYILDYYNMDDVASGSEPTTTNDVTITLTSRDGAVVYNETMDMVTGDVFNLTVPNSGDYKLSCSTINQIKLIGPISRSISESATPTPIIISAYKVGNGMKCDVKNVYQIWFGNPSLVANKCSLGYVTSDLSAIASKVASMQITANNYAQAYYNVLKTNGGASNRIAPDIAFPDPADLQNMTAEQVYAIYLAYLRQMQSWFANYSVMNPEDVNISMESLHLLCRGAILASNGTELYDNTTIFTPYVSLDEINLTIGNNTITTPTFAIKWGSAASLDEYTNITDITYIDLPLNYVLRIEEMSVDGDPVTNVTLTPTTVQYVVYNEFNDITPPQGATDWGWIMAHWYYVALVFGVVVLLGAIMTRSITILVIGLVVVIVGAGGWYLSSGGFHIPGLF